MTRNKIIFVLVLLLGVCFYYVITQSGFRFQNCDMQKFVLEHNTSPQEDKTYIVPASREGGLRSIERYLLDGPDSKADFRTVPPLFEKNHAATNVTNQWILKPNVVQSQRFFMLFFVKSAVAYYKRREMVRNTWGAVQSINGKRLGVVFVLGKVANESLQTQLAQEHELHEDILQSDISDDYKMLPEKTLSAFQWVTYHAMNISDYYAFTDDDCVINLALTYDYFSTNQRSFMEMNAMHCPFIYSAAIGPERSGKYAISSKTYPWGRLPPFCHGGFTVLTPQIMVDLFKQAQVTKRYDLHLEDVYILGILRTKLGRGNDNVKIAYADKKTGSVSFYMGPFVWHIGDDANLFRTAWRVTYNLMNTDSKDFQHLGYWPSANFFFAKLSQNAEIPNEDEQNAFFKKHFAELSNHRPGL